MIEIESMSDFDKILVYGVFECVDFKNRIYFFRGIIFRGSIL